MYGCSCFPQSVPRGAIYLVLGVINLSEYYYLFIVPCWSQLSKCKNLRLSDCYTSASFFICLLIRICLAGGRVGRKDNPDTTAHYCVAPLHTLHTLYSHRLLPGLYSNIRRTSSQFLLSRSVHLRTHSRQPRHTSSEAIERREGPLWLLAPSTHLWASTQLEHTQPTIPQPNIHHPYKPQWFSRHRISCCAQQQHWRRTSISLHIQRSR